MSNNHATGLKRLSRIFFMKMANSLPLSGKRRTKLMRLGGVNIGERSLIYSGVSFDTVYPELITIGNRVRITSGSKIITHFIDPSQPGVHFRIAPVVIEDDVFIGMNTIICNSVTIGKGAMIGAGSVVTKDVPPYQIWAGNPARYIKDRAK
ncbi:MAG: acyltransferase [Prevotella sp.]|nr:acyltransferase [Prevotella sp.]